MLRAGLRSASTARPRRSFSGGNFSLSDSPVRSEAGAAPAAPIPYAWRKVAGARMFKVEITRGLGWKSPCLVFIENIDTHPKSVKKSPRQLLKEYQKEHPESGATGYRILDEHGKRM